MPTSIRAVPIPSSGTVVVEETDLLAGGAIDLLRRLVLDGVPVLVTREQQLGDQRVRPSGAAPGVTVLVVDGRRDVPTTVEPLTAREHEVMRLAVLGATARSIAERLGIGVRTVETHLDHVYRKTGVHSKEELRVALLAS